MARLRILLTGADGLIGSHILDQLLVQEAVSIRAAVTTQAAATKLQQQYVDCSPSSLDLVVLVEQDLRLPGVFDDVLDDGSEPFQAAIYVCSGAPSNTADCLARYISIETETITNFLSSLKDLARKIDRVVIVTTLTPFARWLASPQDERSAVTMSAVEQIDHDHMFSTSQASDNIVHDSIVRWSKENGTSFDLVWLTAPSVYGPSVQSLNDSSEVLEANRRIWNICFQESRDATKISPYGLESFVDVRDYATAIIRGLFTKRALGKRFVVSASTMLSNAEIAFFLRSQFPDLKDHLRLQDSPPQADHSRDTSVGFLDTYLVRNVLGMTRFLSAEETIADTTQQILDLRRRKSWKSITQS